LASSPLLLTLLCLVFEESADFPINRSELYKEGVSILLKKWDAQRNIERDQVYRNLSIPRKEDLLSSVAFTTFERKDYFFKQREVERCIAEYIRNLPDARTDPKALQLDSEVVLKSIEAQHGLLVERARGIYSFSHLTFQEYLTARKIIITSEPQELEKVLRDLSTHITEKRWREVLLLALGMLPNAERLLKLLKQQVDNILANDLNLQKFLIWVHEKSIDYISYKPEAIRCIYFGIGCDLTRDIPKTRSKTLSSEPDLDRVLELVQLLDNQLVNDISSQFSITSPIIRDFIVTRDLARNLAIDLACNLTTIPGLRDKKMLQTVMLKLPDFSKDKSFFKEWWQVNGDDWTKKFRKILIEFYNIGHDWQFSVQQKFLLKQYYNANKMLLECLNSDCYVKREVRQEIRDSLFLPVTQNSV
jgi:predicted NACHT family NTPase